LASGLKSPMLEFDILDFNLNLGAEVIRSKNEDMREIDLDFLKLGPISLYVPESPIEGMRKLKDFLKLIMQKEFVYDKATLELLVRFKTNFLVID
jgi:hypothetical protein